jgi:predicted amidohydrolase YtcJ
MKIILPAAFILLSSCALASAQRVEADLVITNANVRTMGSAQKQGRSIAVLGNRIIAVGSDAETKALVGPKTRVIDAKGKLVIPGFNDAQVHILETGIQLSSVDLRDAKTP